RRDDARNAVYALFAAPLREQVPDSGFEDETERVEAARHDGSAFAVADVEAPAAPERRRDLRQVRHALLLAKPAPHADVEEARRPPGALRQLRGKRGQEFQARRRELAAEPELRGRSDEERFGLGGIEPGQPRAVAAFEAVAAGGAANRQDGHARQRECV